MKKEDLGAKREPAGRLSLWSSESALSPGGLSGDRLAKDTAGRTAACGWAQKINALEAD